MKNHKFTIHHNRKHGLFPVEELKKTDLNIDVSIEDGDLIFDDKVTITFECEDDTDPLEVAYEIGAFVMSCIYN